MSLETRGLVVRVMLFVQGTESPQLADLVDTPLLHCKAFACPTGTARRNGLLTLHDLARPDSRGGHAESGNNVPAYSEHSMRRRHIRHTELFVVESYVVGDRVRTAGRSIQSVHRTRAGLPRQQWRRRKLMKGVRLAVLRNLYRELPRVQGDAAREIPPPPRHNSVQ